MITILAGAGASSAVNNAKYPTTAAFFRNLPEAITNLPLYKMLVRYLPEQRQQDVVDIEQVLWLLTELKAAADAVGSQKQFPGWLLSSGQVGNLQVQQVHANSAVAALRKLADHATSLEIAIQRQVYQLYHGAPTEEEVKANWLPLLAGILAISPPVELFTTNYDIVLETAIQIGRLNINTGRDPDLVYPRLDDRLWDAEPADDPSSRGLLTKLHGSVHWKRGSDGSVYVGDPTDRSKDAGNVIIYPGFKGEILGQPFDMFQSYFQKCLRRSKAVVVIGYAFRDTQINAGLRTHTPPDAALVVIDPAPQPARMPPFNDERLKVIPRGFDASTATEALDIIRARIGPN